ncbi:MAG: rplU [Parcubacteria group bacterium]|nr:rplU [Parcubacteria group bacterium]
MAEATPTKKAAPKKVAKKAPKSSKKASHEASKAFAIIATGGKQYLVRPGQVIKVEKLQGEHKVGDNIIFDSVLLFVDEEPKLGNPFVKGMHVSATLKTIGRLAKVTVIKYKQKSRYFKKNGHRQPYFEVEIDSIK